MTRRRTSFSEYALAFAFGAGAMTVIVKLAWPTLVILAQAALP